ncbi:MAG: hypothetical protein R6V54_04600 [Desulfobacteraceae bacterium]
MTRLPHPSLVMILLVIMMHRLLWMLVVVKASVESGLQEVNRFPGEEKKDALLWMSDFFLDKKRILYLVSKNQQLFFSFMSFA